MKQDKKGPFRPNKPVIEKRRRDRINQSLEQLKAILLNCHNGKRIPFPNKLEKADILELTVEYIKDLVTAPESGGSNSLVQDPNFYRLGYNSCLNEAWKHIQKADRLTDEQKWQIHMSLKDATKNKVNRLFTGFHQLSESTKRPGLEEDRARTIHNQANDMPTVDNCTKKMEVALQTCGKHHGENLVGGNIKTIERSSGVGEAFRWVQSDLTKKRKTPTKSTLDSGQSVNYHIPSYSIALQPEEPVLAWRPW